MDNLKARAVDNLKEKVLKAAADRDCFLFSSCADAKRLISIAVRELRDRDRPPPLGKCAQRAQRHLNPTTLALAMSCLCASLAKLSSTSPFHQARA